ncbi:MAG: hypothetical protein IPF66_24930 [Holophagales bacterium]|nr:hypothetical protein [Holophagales bacterium]
MPISRPLDTSETAWNKVRGIHARLGPEGRIEAAFAVSELAREAVLAGLRMRHPGWSERQLGEALLRKLYGPDLANRALSMAGTPR